MRGMLQRQRACAVSWAGGGGVGAGGVRGSVRIATGAADPAVQPCGASLAAQPGEMRVETCDAHEALMLAARLRPGLRASRRAQPHAALPSLRLYLAGSKSQ